MPPYVQEQLNIFLASKNPMIRYGFSQLLSPHPHFNIQSADNTNQNNTTGRHADIAIIASAQDVQALRRVEWQYNKIRGVGRKTKLIVHLHSQKKTSPPPLLYIPNHVSGITSEHQPIEDILKTIHKVAKGERCISAEYSSHENICNAKHIHLTMREQQVLKMVLEGNTSLYIAETLTLSVKTVECYRANIRRKFNVHSVVELINKSRLLGF